MSIINKPVNQTNYLSFQIEPIIISTHTIKQLIGTNLEFCSSITLRAIDALTSNTLSASFLICTTILLYFEIY